MSKEEQGSAAAGSESSDFWHWMKALPARYQLLSAAAAGVVALLPQSVIPEPLHALRAFGTVIVVVAFLLTWAGRAWIRKHARGIVATTAGLLFTLILVHQVFVKPVDYGTTDDHGSTVETSWVITGWALVDNSIPTLTPRERIEREGREWDELRGIWGGSFVVVALGYSLLHLLVITGLVLSLGGADFAQPRRRRRRQQA